MVYVLPDSVAVNETLHFSNTESVTFTLLPVMNIAPPAILAVVSAKYDLEIVTLLPLREIVPPLELPCVLLPLFMVQLMFSIIP